MSEIKTPTLGLLVSMALQYDKGLSNPAYYGSRHGYALSKAIKHMERAYREVCGDGFHNFDNDHLYEQIAKDAGLDEAGNVIPAPSDRR